MQMLAVAAIAITIKDAFEGHHQNFSIAFSAIQILITYLWWSVGLYDPSHRVFNKFYTFNYLLAFSLLIVSIFTSHRTATILWIIVLVLNLTPGLTGARTIVRVLKERGQVFSASAAIIERFGLFTIIVLAESILGTVNGIAKSRTNTLPHG
jgi:low temperature requirement protein LtrA